MDYLDQKKEHRHRVTLFVGYFLVGLAIFIAATILLYQAYGFGIDKKGAVIQNGLTFFSSKPSPADITIDGKLNSKKTNTRLVLPGGIYRVKLSRAGYHDWQRTIELSGGDVKHYDYPFLFPKELTTKAIQTYAAAPGFTTQSSDQRWMLIQPGASLLAFEVRDLNDPAKAAVNINLPTAILSKSVGAESWQLGEWAADDRHVLLKHIFDGKVEFVLVDIQSPQESLNLSLKFALSSTDVTFRDKKYDQYYLLDGAGNLQTIDLSQTGPKTILAGVISYKSYGNDTLLYATNIGAAPGKTRIKMTVGEDTYNIKSLSANTVYLLDLTKYSGSMYVAVGATADNRVYIYKDPAGQLNAEPTLPPTTTRVLRIDQVNYISFSATAQFVMAQSGNRFGVYDFENKAGFVYKTTAPIDAPQTHANWMDGHRLYYVSAGILHIFDYDGINLRNIMPMSSNYLPAFDPDYKNIFSLAPNTIPSQLDFTQTSLLTAADR